MGLQPPVPIYIWWKRRTAGRLPGTEPDLVRSDEIDGGVWSSTKVGSVVSRSRTTAAGSRAKATIGRGSRLKAEVVITAKSVTGRCIMLTASSQVSVLGPKRVESTMGGGHASWSSASRLHRGSSGSGSGLEEAELLDLHDQIERRQFRAYSVRSQIMGTHKLLISR